MQNSKKTIIPQVGSNRLFYLINNTGFTDVINKQRKYIALILHVCIIIFLCSCTSTKKIVYFKNLERDTLLKNIVSPDYELKIQNNDVLSIKVNSLSPDNSFYNAGGGSESTGAAGKGAVSAGSGYPVDANGNIEFPKLGTIHVAGMTKKQLQDSLQNALVPYLKESIVSVNFTSRHITMLGGISPQVMPLADNMTVLDALAQSGDIGERGRIDNILVIRDTAGAKIFKRLNLNNSSIFSSPYYYMQPNDIVYVEPMKQKVSTSALQIASLVTGSISILVLLITQISKL